MIANSQLNKVLLSLENKIKNLEVTAALNVIDEEITNTTNDEFIPHLQVHKATVLRYSGKLKEAVSLLIRASEQYSDVDSVNFFAGQYLLELGDLHSGIDYLTKCINLSTKSDESWYLDSAYLLRAYCAAKTGDKNLAYHDLELIMDDTEMFWISVQPTISKSSIKCILESYSD